MTGDLVAAGLAGEAPAHAFGPARFARVAEAAPMIRVNGTPDRGPRRGDGRRPARRRWAIDAGARGVAVAVDGEVVPRGEWPARAVPAGARVEALTAMQGG